LIHFYKRVMALDILDKMKENLHKKFI